MKKNILKTGTTFLLLLGCVIFGITGCKACQNAKNDNNITLTKKNASNGLKRANDNQALTYENNYIKEIDVISFENVTNYNSQHNNQELSFKGNGTFGYIEYNNQSYEVNADTCTFPIDLDELSLVKGYYIENVIDENGNQTDLLIDDNFLANAYWSFDYETASQNFTTYQNINNTILCNTILTDAQNEMYLNQYIKINDTHIKKIVGSLQNDNLNYKKEFFPNENGETQINMCYFPCGESVDLKIEYDNNYSNVLNFNSINEDTNALNLEDINQNYLYDKMTILYDNYVSYVNGAWPGDYQLASYQEAQYIYNFNYLTNKAIIFNNALSENIGFVPYTQYTFNNINYQLTANENNTFATYTYNTNEYIRLYSFSGGYGKLNIASEDNVNPYEFYVFENNLYSNNFGLPPHTMIFNSYFTHDNINIEKFNNAQQSQNVSYYDELALTKYFLDNSTMLTNEQINQYESGYIVGHSNGIKDATEWTNIIRTLAKSLESILNIEILPNITIKILILVPIMFSILSFIVKTFVK